MKTYPLLLAALLALPVIVRAQSATTGVPGFISYQGRVLDVTGAPIGGNGTPVNRTVIFRIWDHPSNTLNANLIYSEQQTVTIADGEFSVLVGQGVATDSTQFGFLESSKGPPNAALANAFGGSARYLGVTIEDGTPAVDNEITPRQQIVSSAFAFRARFAETLGTSAGTALNVLDSGHVGIGTSQPPALFTITGANTGTSSSAPQLLITDSADTNERLRIGVDSTGNGMGFLQSFKEGLGPTSLLLNPEGGNVGIGTTNPIASLQYSPDWRGLHVNQAPNGVVAVQGTSTARLHLRASNNTANVTQDFIVDNSSNRITLGWLGSGLSSRLNVMTMLSNGNVGIGIDSPASTLQVNGGIRARGGAPGLAGASNNGYAFSGSNGDNDSGMFSTADGTLQFFTNNAERVRVNASGWVGIGTTSPGFPLEVAGGSSLAYETSPLFDYITNFPNAGLIRQTGSRSVSIRAQNWVASAGFVAISDGRIKDVVATPDGTRELDLIQQLRVTDYRMKDVVNHGAWLHQGFIAQEVEELLPEAVQKTRDFIPDIYAVADKLLVDADNRLATITLANPHQLAQGDRVRLHSDDSTQECTVAGVIDAFTFQVDDFEGAPRRLFVFGREVDDFRQLDYDRIFTVGIAALQQLKREKDEEVEALLFLVREQQEKLTAQDRRLMELEARESARMAQLAAIEKILASLELPTPRPATLLPTGAEE
jgi:hypothetical protein